MKNETPILIAGPPRCGTTMLAGLFYHHGVWIGKARLTSHPATNSALGTENIEIKQYLKSLLGGYKNWSLPLPDISAANHQQFKNDILSLVYTDKKWLVKTSNLLLTWQLWSKAFPNAVWVFPKRAREAIVNSALKHPVMKRHGRLIIDRFINACQERQAYIAKFVNGINIDVNELIINNQTRQNLFSAIGMASEYDCALAEKWINPNLWHETKNG